jgi:hypothetical protein
MNLSCHALTTADTLETVRSFWLSENRHPDADPDFFKLFLAANGSGMRPHVLVASENGTVKALLLGRVEDSEVAVRLGYFRLFRMRVRQFVSLQFGCLGDQCEWVQESMVRQLCGGLRGAGLDRAVLYNLPVDSCLFESACRVPPLPLRDFANRTARRWRTTLPASLDEFLKRRSRKHRYWLKRIGRVFEDAHPGRVRYAAYTSKEDVEPFCRHAEKVAQATYQRGLGVGFRYDDQTKRRLELAADKGWMRGYVMFLDDQPVAFWFGRLYRGVMVLDWTGYIPGYRKYELGTILFLKMVEDLCQSKAREIDYGTGASFYKERFGDVETLEGFVTIYAPTVRGLLSSVMITVDARLNRIAKAVAERLRIGDRLKKHWRGKLTSQPANEDSMEESQMPVAGEAALRPQDAVGS